MAAFRLKTCRHSINKCMFHKNVRLVSNYALKTNDSKPKANYVITKFTELNEWYVKLTGLDEIKRLQDKVINLQEKLQKAQEERREIGKLLVEVRKRSTDLQEQLLNCKRWENTQRFLELTKEETEVMKSEKELTAKFEVLDKSEREIFTVFSNAVRDSHEKEKAQSEYTKYWGIILSIIGTVVGAVVSTIISTVRNHQIVSGINRGIGEKFLEIQKLNADNRLKAANLELTRETKDKEDKTSGPILEEITKNQEKIEALLQNMASSRYVLSVDKIRDGDKFLDINSFIEAQRTLLEQHRDEIKEVLHKSENSGVIFPDLGYSKYILYGCGAIVFFLLSKYT